MLARRIARPMFAVGFAAEGVDAVRHPDAHVARVRAAWQEAARALEIPDPPSDTVLRALVRGHGVALAVLAVCLATGKAPRTAALALAALTLPAAVVNQPFGDPAATVAGAATSGARPVGSVGTAGRRPDEKGLATARRAGLERFVRTLSLAGGALLVALDREGRPGVAWRLQHARVDRVAAKEAKAAIAVATAHATAASKEAAKLRKAAA